LGILESDLHTKLLFLL